MVVGLRPRLAPLLALVLGRLGAQPRLLRNVAVLLVVQSLLLVVVQRRDVLVILILKRLQVVPRHVLV